MRVSLNLVSRSVILMAFPVFCQLIFILVMTFVLRQAQEKLEQQWRSENLIRLTFSVCRDASDLMVWVQLPADMREAVGADVSTSWLSRARRDSESLSRLASENPKMQKAVLRMSTADNEMHTLLETMLSRIQDTKGYQYSPPSVFYMRRVLGRCGKVFYNAVEKIVSIEKQERTDTNLYGLAFSTIYMTLLAAVFAGIAVAVMLGYIYAISISRPLKHLSENGRLLAARKPLLPQLNQQDEFGKLDAMLHNTATEIEATLLKEREAIENAADLICTLDENGVFLSVNTFAKRMLGYGAELFHGRPLNSFTVPEQSLLADEYIRGVIASSEVKQFELRLIKAGGESIDTCWSSLWSTAEKKLFCVVRDITEEKKIELLKQDFADMISHDLRSPLMAMGNSLTLLKTGVKGEMPAAASQRIEMSARNVEKLIVLVDDLLDFQKLKAGKMELELKPVVLQAIIKDAADLVGEAARDKGVEIELPEGETIVQGDRNKLMQAAVNLISNAIKFSGAGAKVLVRVESNEQTDSFSVFDTGPGVPAEFQGRIFEPFEQAPSGKRSEGTGLGLAICRLVIEAHGGKIRVIDRADVDGVGGSVFTVELPTISQKDTKSSEQQNCNS